MLSGGEDKSRLDILLDPDVLEAYPVITRFFLVAASAVFFFVMSVLWDETWAVPLRN
jgi:hypothetical protein